MIYKVCNVYDMSDLPMVDRNTWTATYENARILTYEYGADRDVIESDGGYILVVGYGTSNEELRKRFDYTKHPIEYITRSETEPHVLTVGYLLGNDYVVVIIIHEYDAPPQMLNALKEGY